jgi:3-hydroxyisobutyrate dehydrogenase-like beta-hydroxyacid dehydrogenase
MKRRRLVARSTIGVMTDPPPRVFILPRILPGNRGDGNRRHCNAGAETAIIRARQGTVTMPNGKPTIAFIGFGEAGQAIAAGLRGAGVATMSAWDILFPQAAGLKLKEAAQAAGVHCANSAADAVRGVDLIISAVTAASSVDAVQSVRAHLAGTPYFLDINSVSPGRKQDTAKLLGDAGRYVDVAVLAPIYPARHQTPMLLAGPYADAIAPALTSLGMRVSVAGAETGAAAAIKMVRSVMIKGIEALTLECFLAASRAGVIDEVAASMKNNYPGLDWAKIVPYNLERMANHGERRAAEMEEVADTLRELGVEPLMTSATVKRQREMGQIGSQQSVRGALNKDRVAMLGAISAAARDRN